MYYLCNSEAGAPGELPLFSILSSRENGLFSTILPRLQIFPRPLLRKFSKHLKFPPSLRRKFPRLQDFPARSPPARILNFS